MEKKKKTSSWSPRAWSDVFKLLLASTPIIQNPETQRVMQCFILNTSSSIPSGHAAVWSSPFAADMHFNQNVNVL